MGRPVGRRKQLLGAAQNASSGSLRGSPFACGLRGGVEDRASSGSVKGGAVEFHDPTQPFWSWHKIEKFWVDAIFFHGSIPDFIGFKWPWLRTIDLYNNELTGTIPASMARLTDLTQIQLQDNDLTGEVPQALFHLPKLRVLRMAMNRGLHAKVMVDEIRASPLKESPLSLNIPYTGIQMCHGAAKRRRVLRQARRKLLKRGGGAPTCSIPIGFTRSGGVGVSNTGEVVES